MKIEKSPLLFISLLLLGHFLCAQNIEKEYSLLLKPVKTQVVYQTKKPPILDGKDEEADWKQVKWIDDFEDIEGAKNPGPLYRTRVKMLYDSSALYLLAELQEPHLWATYNRHDMIIYHENDFEVFIDPDGDTHNYFEYELNALNTLLDLKMPMPYRNGGKADISWDSKGFQSAVSIDGTLNDGRDRDAKWSVEMKIPFADLGLQQAPKDGQTLKIDFSRVEWQTHFTEGHYEKIKDPSTASAFPEYNWVWSPPGIINMHYPERWAMIQFSEKQPGSKTVDFRMPEKEVAGKYLWLVYYKQQDFKRNSSRYANNFEELEFPLPAKTDLPKITLTATTNQFIVQATLKDGSVISINETGLFLTKNIEQ
jgi:hypothetical protein